MSQRKRLNRWLPAIAFMLLTLALTGCGGGGGDGSSGSATPPQPPAQPSGVTATATTGQATVSWTGVAGATSYNIYYSATAGQETTPNGVKLISQTSPQAITGLTDETTYYFVVTAVDASGESAPSSEVSATPITNPKGIVASAENSQATVAWLSVRGATSYNLYYGTTNPVTILNGTKIPVTSPAAGTSNGTPYFEETVPSLNNGTTYYFAVTAVNDTPYETVLSSQKSAVPNATTPKPGSPAAVTISSTVAGQVHIVWGDYVPDATSYNAYYLQQSAAPTTAQVLNANNKVPLATPSPQDLSGFATGLTYWFVVTAVNANTSQESGGQTSPKSVVVQ